jgi:hypothetical protein
VPRRLSLESNEKESEEIIARTQDRGDGGNGSGWPLFFFLSLRHICVRVIIFFKTSNGDACIHTQGRNRDEGKGREKEKEYRDLFHPSAAFGTS